MYVYVWKLPSVPEVIVTPSILKLISEPQFCVNSCTGKLLVPAGQLATGGDSAGDGDAPGDGGRATGGDIDGDGGLATGGDIDGGLATGGDIDGGLAIGGRIDGGLNPPPGGATAGGLQQGDTQHVTGHS